VDQENVCLHGICIYVGNSFYTYTVEVLALQSDSVEKWFLIEKMAGVIGPKDFEVDTVRVKLAKSVKLEPLKTYCLRLYLQGSNTFSGEGGINIVHGRNRVKFTFFPTSLSLNGTSVSRGQIPSLLYSINDKGHSSLMSGQESARQIMAIAKCFVDKLTNSDLLKTDAPQPNESDRHDDVILNFFVPRFFGHLLELCDRLPLYSYEMLNLFIEPFFVVTGCNSVRRTELDTTPGFHSTSTNIETQHPYEPCTVNVFTIDAMNSHFMVVDFDTNFSTCQSTDFLAIYTKTNDGQKIPIARLYENNWPKRPMLMPASDLTFIFQSTTRPKNVAPETMYGFKCTIRSHTIAMLDNLLWFEIELVNLCATVCASLVSKSHHLAFSSTLSKVSPSDVRLMEDDLWQVTQDHASLLSKGINLTHVPSFNEIITGKLHADTSTPEVAFLYDLIASSHDTVAGELSRWLMPDAYVDPHHCELIVVDSGNEASSSPSEFVISITVISRDQFGRKVYNQNTKVDVWITNFVDDSASNNKQLSFSQHDEQLLRAKYQPTYMNRARYVSITMIKSLQNVSFEELRLLQQSDLKTKETITLMANNNDLGVYQARWTPKQNGIYKFEGHIDGYLIKNILTIEIRNGRYYKSPAAQRRQTLNHGKAECLLSDSRGVRIRNECSLTTSCEIGHVLPGSTLFYVDMCENDDGTWVRLSEESFMLFCGKQKLWKLGWCLQYNKHLGKRLLNLDSTDSVCKDDSTVVLQSLTRSIVVQCDENYVVSRQTDDGVPIYSHPTKNSRVVGVVNTTNIIQAVGWIQNADGIWIKLSDETFSKFKSSSPSSHTSGYCCIQQGCISSSNVLKRITPPVTAMSTSPSNNKISNLPLAVRNLQSLKKSQNQQDNSATTSQNVLPAFEASVVDTVRTIFASVLWHENLVNDAIACAAYLKYHPDLQNTNANSSSTKNSEYVASDSGSLPESFKLLCRLWNEIFCTTLDILRNHVILPSAPMLARTENGTRSNANGSELVKQCELCSIRFSSLLAHMKLEHPGCRQASTTHGYNEQGKYGIGSRGTCGKSIDSPGTIWYLLCTTCRQRYIGEHANDKEIKKHRARSFRLSNVCLEPHQILKNNALFLLQLNSTDQACLIDKKLSGIFVSKTASKKISRDIDSHQNSMIAHNLKIARKLSRPVETDLPGSNNGPHSSDPGPKNHNSRTWSIHNHSESFNKEVRCGMMTNFATDSQVLLSSPSTALKAIVPPDNKRRSLSETCQRSVVAFVVQHHDLNSLQNALHLATSRAIFFEHAFQTLNTLLRSTTNPISISDVLFHFICSLTDVPSGKDNNQQQPHAKLVHPLRLTLFAGSFKVEVIRKFHSLLQSVGSILRSYTNVSLLTLQNCCRAWMFDFLTKDQDLIIQTNIVATLNRIVSERTDGSFSSSVSTLCESLVDFGRQMDDISDKIELHASSHQQMVACMLDKSPETFWESGDTDQGKTKVLDLVNRCQLPLSLVSIYVDNVVDAACRVKRLCFYKKTSNHVVRLAKMQSVDHQFVGWINCALAGHVGNLALHVDSFDPQVRVRKLVVTSLNDLLAVDRRHNNRQQPTLHLSINFDSLQADAFDLLQSIAQFAFKENVLQDAKLQAQVMDLLISTSHNTAYKLRDYIVGQMSIGLLQEMELLRCHPSRNYLFCQRLLTLFNRIYDSGGTINNVVESSLPHNASLLLEMSRLVHFSAPALQQAVLQAMQNLLRIITPTNLDSRSFFDHLLLCLVKAAVFQLKSLPSSDTTSNMQRITCGSVMKDNNDDDTYDQRVHVDLNFAKALQALLRSLSRGDYGPMWAQCAKSHLSHCLTNPAILCYSYKDCHVLIERNEFWLAASSLLVIEDESWLTDSPTWQHILERVRRETSYCDNHEDGTTIADVYCKQCSMHLCQECSFILHLRKVRRQHSFQQLNNSLASLKLTIHRTCCRLKTAHFTLSIDYASLHGLVDFRRDVRADLLRRHSDDQDAGRSTKCRFCGFNTAIVQDTCYDKECQDNLVMACQKTLECGHKCGGLANEAVCLPCLK